MRLLSRTPSKSNHPTNTYRSARTEKSLFLHLRSIYPVSLLRFRRGWAAAMLGSNLFLMINNGINFWSGIYINQCSVPEFDWEGGDMLAGSGGEFATILRGSWCYCLTLVPAVRHASYLRWCQVSSGACFQVCPAIETLGKYKDEKDVTEIWGEAELWRAMQLYLALQRSCRTYGLEHIDRKYAGTQRIILIC